MSEAPTDRDMQQRIEEKIFGKPEEIVAKAPVKPETAPVEGEVESAQADMPEGQDGIPGGASVESAEELLEVEFSGAKYQVPKELKPALDGYKDYTEKTMAAAERQKQADLIIEQNIRSQALHKTLQPKYDSVRELQKNVEAYEKVDWNTWIASDPVEAQKGMLQLQVLRDKLGRAQHDLQQAANDGMRSINEIRERLISENEKVLKQKLKGWTADTRKALDAFAENTYGYSKEELSQVFDARVLRMMNDAKQWNDLQASKPQAQKKATQVATLKPSATETKNAAQSKEAELKKAIRLAKTDVSKQRAVQALLEHKLH
jgi:hypothetical protein